MDDERTIRFEPVQVLVGAPSYSVTPGGSVTVPFRIRNRTGKEDYFEVTIRGIPSTWVMIDLPVLHLSPGEEREESLVVKPPEGMAGSTGTTVVVIKVSSQADPDQAGEAEFDLQMRAAGLAGPTTVSGPVEPQFSSDLSPSRVIARQTARVRIYNPGDIKETFVLGWKTIENDLEFVPTSPGPVNVLPGETVAVDFVVSTRKPYWFGSPVVLPYTVTVRSGRGEEQSHRGEVSSRALIPVWALPVLIVFCMTVLCGISFLWNWRQDQLKAATQTAIVAVGQAEEAAATASYYQTAAVLAGQEDTDGDGLTNQQEEELGTDPGDSDTDNDRLLDGEEIARGTNPFEPDSDGDGLLDGVDLEPLDSANPALTATFIAGQPTVTETSSPEPTVTFTLPVPTETVVPTNTPPLQTPTSTDPSVPLPEIGQGLIVFESDREGDSDLYVYKPEDGNITQLTSRPEIDSQPVWSPDGARIAFAGAQDGNNEIFLLDIASGSLSNLTGNPADDNLPDWSEDGNWIIFTSDRDGSRDIFIMKADGSDPVNLTQSEANDFAPVWQANGNKILFTSDRNGNNEIYAMNIDGSEPINLTQNEASDSFPAVPRNGGLILFVSDRDGNDDIYRMDPNGDNVIKLTNNPARDTLPIWSPDENWIAFTSDRDSNLEIYVMRANGDDPTNLSRNSAQDSFASWR